MTTEHLADIPLRILAEQVRERTLTVTELTRIALANRCERLNAYKVVDAQSSLAQAKRADDFLDAGGQPEVLHGIPVSVKDLYGVTGYPIFAGTPCALPEEMSVDGPIIAALRDMYVVFTGKTHTVEFAFGGLGTNPHWPDPVNPWSGGAPRVAGGSSAGAGVSLCEGSAKLALGTDTAGSVRIPASYTGNVAVKTTAGRWPTQGIVPLSATLDTAGVLARTMADLIVGFEEIDGARQRVAADVELSGMRLGRGEVFFWDDLSPGIAEAIDGAISELEAGGAQIVSVEMDEAYPTFELFKQGGPVSIELHRFISERLPTWLDKMDPNVAARVGDAGALPRAEYQRRLDVMRDLAQRAHRHLAEVEAILTPTVAVTPPILTDVEDSEVYRSKNLLSLRNTSIVSYLGLCAATVPVGVDAEAMPVGLQIIGKGGDDARVLAIAAAIERRLGTARDRLGTPPQLG